MDRATVATRYWHRTGDGRVQCDVCPRACRLQDGQRGLCFVRLPMRLAPIAREIALLAEHGLEPTAALTAATTSSYRFLGEPFDQAGQPATLVTYQDDPREDLAVLSSPLAIIIDGVRVR